MTFEEWFSETYQEWRFDKDYWRNMKASCKKAWDASRKDLEATVEALETIILEQGEHDGEQNEPSGFSIDNNTLLK